MTPEFRYGFFVAIQHPLGVLNAYQMLKQLADGRYVFAALSAGCMLLVASWNVRALKKK